MSEELMSHDGRVSIVFGTGKEASVNRRFKTQREMEAYFCALEDYDGWLEYTYVENGIDGWVKNSDGTWKQENEEYTIKTYNQKAPSYYKQFANGKNDS